MRMHFYTPCVHGRRLRSRDAPELGRVKGHLLLLTHALYSSTVIGTLAADGWAVAFGTATRGLRGLRTRPVPSSLYEM